MRTWLLAVVCLACLAPRVGADDPPAGPEMKRLAGLFVGTWSMTVTSASGSTTTGEEVWRTEPGGMPLVERYHARTATGGDDYDVAYFWWDGSTSKYRGLFCATFVDQGCAGFDFAWSANDIVLTGADTEKGERVAWKETFTFDAPTSFSQTLEIGPPGALKTVSTIRAKFLKE